MTTNHATIVVGVDGSAGAEAALTWAVGTAARWGARLTLVNSHPLLDDVPLRGQLSLTPMLQEDSRALLSKAKERVAQIGWTGPDPMLVSDGPPPEVLLGRESDVAALVVVGRRGHAPLTPHLGSRAARLIGACRVPVVVVPEDWGSRNRIGIVLGVKPGKSADEAAIDFAFRAAQEAATPLSVLSVCRPLSIAAPGEFYREYEAELVQDTRIGQAEALAGWTEEYPDVEVRRMVTVDHPVRALAEQSRAAQLLVLGASAHHRLDGGLGSVTRSALQHAGCPVVVVPEG